MRLRARIFGTFFFFAFQNFHVENVRKGEFSKTVSTAVIGKQQDNRRGHMIGNTTAVCILTQLLDFSRNIHWEMHDTRSSVQSWTYAYFNLSVYAVKNFSDNVDIIIEHKIALLMQCLKAVICVLFLDISLVIK
jgi:hypothetical protein